MMQKIRIKYFRDDMEKLTYIDGKSDWIDLRAAEDVEMKAGEFKLVRSSCGSEKQHLQKLRHYPDESYGCHRRELLRR